MCIPSNLVNLPQLTRSVSYGHNSTNAMITTLTQSSSVLTSAVNPELPQTFPTDVWYLWSVGRLCMQEPYSCSAPPTWPSTGTWPWYCCPPRRKFCKHHPCKSPRCPLSRQTHFEVCKKDSPPNCQPATIKSAGRLDLLVKEECVTEESFFESRVYLHNLTSVARRRASLSRSSRTFGSGATGTVGTFNISPSSSLTRLLGRGLAAGSCSELGPYYKIWYRAESWYFLHSPLPDCGQTILQDWENHFWMSAATSVNRPLVYLSGTWG